MSVRVSCERELSTRMNDNLAAKTPYDGSTTDPTVYGSAPGVSLTYRLRIDSTYIDSTYTHTNIHTAAYGSVYVRSEHNPMEVLLVIGPARVHYHPRESRHPRGPPRGLHVHYPTYPNCARAMVRVVPPWTVCVHYPNYPKRHGNRQINTNTTSLKSKHVQFGFLSVILHYRLVSQFSSRRRPCPAMPSN